MKSHPSVENLFVYFGPQVLLTNISFITEWYAKNIDIMEWHAKISTRTLPKIEPKPQKKPVPFFY